MLLVAAAGMAGCDQPKQGPKRPDNEAAHSRLYHPDVRRVSATRPGAGSSRPSTQPSSGPTSEPASRPAARSDAGPVGTPVLFVNGDTVTVPDILEPILEALKDDARALSPEAYQAAKRRAIRRQIDLHVSTLLIYQEAKNTYPEKAMEVVDKEIDRRIKEVINERHGGVRARYEAQLKSMDLTMDDVRSRIRRQLLVTQYMRDRFKPLLREPPRRQLYQYYEAHLDEFTTPERAEMLLIEIPLEAVLGAPRNAATAQQIVDARKRAVAQLKRAREELDSGVEFTAVARAYSKGLKAAQGGVLSEISPGALRGRWAKSAEVLFTLSENQTSDVIETDDAAFIVRCGKRTPPQQVSFEEAQNRIIERLKDEQFNQLSQEHVGELLAKATVHPVAEFAEAVAAAAPRPQPPTRGNVEAADAR
ncbi:MAG: peptidyl-prolyl cis-trans isomerase [Planctomycetes bacterium]|nr:peptidyl-prolyl cis-trans isomerase [Planctomycetota bacterium]